MQDGGVPAGESGVEVVGGLPGWAGVMRSSRRSVVEVVGGSGGRTDGIECVGVAGQRDEGGVFKD